MVLGFFKVDAKEIMLMHNGLKDSNSEVFGSKGHGSKVYGS